MELSPIILFVYNRPWHTRKTVKALLKNNLAKESELIIYSDADKTSESEKEVMEVRKFIRTITGFKTVQIIERTKNWGLANSIIEGVSSVINKYGKIIVLEDDMVTSPAFLTYMNNALDFYKNESKVWHISGWNYPISVNNESKSSAFLWRVMNCWGWATWADRWQYYDNNIENTIQGFSQTDIMRFNLDGSENFFGQVLDNKEGKITTWAIFWYATIFKNNGLCLNPYLSYLRNIGLDGSGENCIPDRSEHGELNESDNIFLPEIIQENKQILSLIQQYYKNSRTTYNRFKRLLKNYVLHII